MTRIKANLGVTGLATDVYLPDRMPAPVVVTRTPYDRAALRADGLGWARHGFVFVAQDVRGRYGSPGLWRPYLGERADGAALLGWVHRQDWCDGRIAVSGASYAAFTAWAAALTTPELTAAVLSQVPAMGTERVSFDPSGILRLTEHAGWWGEHADAHTSRTGLAKAMLTTDPSLLRHLPVRDIGERLWADAPGWWPAVAGGPSAKSAEAVTDEELAAWLGPVLHIGGWYDLFLSETLHQWRLAGGSLLVGPWTHELSTPDTSRVGLRDHGPGSQVPIGPHQVTWLKHAIDGADTVSTQVFRLGDNRWLAQWPPRTSALTLHAQADGGLRAEQAAPGEFRFTYDPTDPVPSVLPGHDRRLLDGRADVATFRTSPLEQPLSIAGAPRTRLNAATSAPGTDWVVRLSERRIDGSVAEIGSAAATTAEDEITMPVTAITVPAGSRLELSVTSSDFPWLARNLNTGADRYTTTAFITAEQCVRTGTAVVLPVMENL